MSPERFVALYWYPQLQEAAAEETTFHTILPTSAFWCWLPQQLALSWCSHLKPSLHFIPSVSACRFPTKRPYSILHLLRVQKIPFPNTKAGDLPKVKSSFQIALRKFFSQPPWENNLPSLKWKYSLLLPDKSIGLACRVQRQVKSPG